MSSAHAAWVRTGAWGPCAHPALLRSGRVRRQKRCSIRVQVVGLETARSMHCTIPAPPAPKACSLTPHGWPH